MTIIKHIEVVPYNPDWPRMFEEEAELIKKVLANNCLAVHHVGSTSVPGLSAKPIIDVIGVVKNPEAATLALESIGFKYKGEYNIPLHFGFSKRENIKVNLHVYEEGHAEIDLNLLFRNYLRDHPTAYKEYARLKYNLLKDKSSFEKNNSLFTGYNLGKNAFISNILHQAGFNRLRIVRCTHYAEWNAAKHFRQKYFFDKSSIVDPYTWTFNHPSNVHFALYKGSEVIGYVHLQLWSNHRAAMRIIVIDEPFRNRKFGEQFLTLCEKWLKHQGYKSLHTESSPKAYAFYKRHHYKEMPFNDPDGYTGHPEDIAIGKIL